MPNRPPTPFTPPSGNKCFFTVGPNAHCRLKPYRDIWFSGKTVTACRRDADEHDGQDLRYLDGEA